MTDRETPAGYLIRHGADNVTSCIWRMVGGAVLHRRLRCGLVLVSDRALCGARPRRSSMRSGWRENYAYRRCPECERRAEKIEAENWKYQLIGTRCSVSVPTCGTSTR